MDVIQHELLMLMVFVKPAGFTLPKMHTCFVYTCMCSFYAQQHIYVRTVGIKRCQKSSLWL